MKKGSSKPTRKPVDSDDESGSEVDYRSKQAQQKKIVHDSDSEQERFEESDGEGHSAEENGKGAKDSGDDKREIFIKSLSYDVDEDALKKIFGKFGSMTKCKLVMQNGRSRGIAFIEYEIASSAKKAIDSENGATHMGREITVDYSGNKPNAPDGGQRQESRDNADSNTVFVGNISFNTSEDSVRDFFSKVGNITSVRIAMGEDGRARGFCHVEFESPAVAKNALSLSGQDLDGRAVRLDLSGGRKPGFGGGRGGFGGDRGGRGGRGGFGGGRGGFGGDRRGGFGDRGGRGGYGDRRGGSSFGGGDRRGGRGGDRGGFKRY